MKLIAAAHCAALDGFQEKAHRPAARNLEKRRHRRLQIADQGGPHDLRIAARVDLREPVRGRLDLHGRAQEPPPPMIWPNAFSLMLTPISL